MQVETATSEQQLPVGKQDAAGDEDVNIVDDVEDEIEPESDQELNRSFEEMVSLTILYCECITVTRCCQTMCPLNGVAVPWLISYYLVTGDNCPACV